MDCLKMCIICIFFSTGDKISSCDLFKQIKSQIPDELMKLNNEQEFKTFVQDFILPKDHLITYDRIFTVSFLQSLYHHYLSYIANSHFSAKLLLKHIK